MKDWLIIDGYNLLHQIAAATGESDFNVLRRNILATLESLAGILARRITIVFDGKSANTSADHESKIVEIIYSPSDRSADTVIANLVWNADNPENILVVTSDRLERDNVRARGADTIASSLFITMLDEHVNRLGERLMKHNERNENFTLGDLFPDMNQKGG